jgi:transposase
MIACSGSRNGPVRYRTEHMFNKLRQARRTATRYDKTSVSFLGFLNIAAARMWLRTLPTGASFA